MSALEDQQEAAAREAHDMLVTMQQARGFHDEIVREDPARCEELLLHVFMLPYICEHFRTGDRPIRAIMAAGFAACDTCARKHMRGNLIVLDDANCDFCLTHPDDNLFTPHMFQLGPLVIYADLCHECSERWKK